MCEPIELGKRQVLFGVCDSDIVNHVIIVCKDIINRRNNLDLEHLKTRMVMERETEAYIAKWGGTMEKHCTKWIAWMRS